MDRAGGGFRKSTDSSRRFGTRSVSNTPSASAKKRGSTPTPAPLSLRGRSASPVSAAAASRREQHQQQQQQQQSTRAASQQQVQQHALDQIPTLNRSAPAPPPPPPAPKADPPAPSAVAVSASPEAPPLPTMQEVVLAQSDEMQSLLGQVLPGGERALRQEGDPFKFTGTLQNMYQLRRQIDDLQESHKREEVALIHSMKHMIETNQVEKGQLTDLVENTETRLRKEQEEKVQAVSLYHQFKDQGDGIIQRLSTSLTDLQRKYAEDGNRCVFLQKEVIRLQQELRTEHQNRAGLENQITQYQMRMSTVPGMAHPSLGAPPQPPPPSSSAPLPVHAMQLQDLIREKDATIVMLERQMSANNNNNNTSTLSALNTTPAASVAESSAPQDLHLLREEVDHWKRRCEVLQRNTNTSSSPDTTANEVLLRNDVETWKSRCEQTEKVLSAKMEDYKNLIVQQDARLQTLQSSSVEKDLKIKGLEEKVSFIDVAGQNFSGTDYDSSRVIVSNLLTDSTPTDPRHAALMENAVVKMLVEQLKTEKRHRLETEEQSDRMLMETSKQISSLEDRLKATDRRDRDRDHPRANRTPRGYSFLPSAISHPSLPVSRSTSPDPETPETASSPPPPPPPPQTHRPTTPAPTQPRPTAWEIPTQPTPRIPKEDDEEEEEGGIRDTLLRWQRVRQRSPPGVHQMGVVSGAASASVASASASARQVRAVREQGREVSASPSSHYTPSAPTASPTLSHASLPHQMGVQVHANLGREKKRPEEDLQEAEEESSILKRLKRHLDEPLPGVGVGVVQQREVRAPVALPVPAAAVAVGVGGEGKAVSGGGGGGGGGGGSKSHSPPSSPTKACSDSLCELERLLEELSVDVMRSPERQK